jgi:hypothetical protein
VFMKLCLKDDTFGYMQSLKKSYNVYTEVNDMKKEGILWAKYSRALRESYF